MRSLPAVVETMNRTTRAGLIASSMLALLLGAAGCAKPPEAPLGAALVQGGIEAVVTKVELANIDFEGPTGAVAAKAPTLLVHLKLTNKSAQPVRYDLGWATTSATQATSPLLFLDPGPKVVLTSQGQIPGVLLTSLSYPPDPVTTPRTLNPGEGLDDVLLFQAPPESARALLLSLPPSLFGASARMPAYVRIPAPAGPAAAPAEVGLGETFTGDVFSLRLDAVETAFPKVTRADGQAGTTTAPFVAVRVTISNTSQGAIDYLPPSASLAFDPPAATDPAGAPIPRADFGAGARIEGTAAEKRTVAPGQSLTDTWWFARPDAQVTELRLTVPGKRFGGTGLVRAKLPYAWSNPTPFAEPAPAAEGSAAAAPP